MTSTNHTMESMNHNNDDLFMDQQVMLFLHQIKKELNLPSARDAAKYVTSVLHALRQTLSLEKSESLLNRLPDFLKMAFASNWKQYETPAVVNHLDEFVGLVMERDLRHNKGLFKNEIHTLTVILLTLKKLQKLIDIENFEGLSQPFRRELRDLSSSVPA